jgi:hypothetical protein
MSGRLTFDRPDGTWVVAGMHEGNESDKMYAVAAKLHAYEKSGLSPSDLQDLCALINEWNERQEGRFTRKADGYYHIIECFKRCGGACNSPCVDCEVDGAIIRELGRYEDTGLSPTEYADVAKIIGRAVPCEKKLTRIEAFRQLSDEQMAALILENDNIWFPDLWCLPCCPKADETSAECVGGQVHCVLAWLREEVSGDEDLLQARRRPS